MSSAVVTLNCTPEVFFENHVDFEHFSTVHKGYSDPRLITVSWTRDEYTTMYSLLYDKYLKQKLIYHYVVRRLSESCWRGIIETKTFGILCRIDFVGRLVEGRTVINITTSAEAWWMTPGVRKAMADRVLKSYLRDFAADKAEIDGRSGRFPKPALSEEDLALREFREFVKATF